MTDPTRALAGAYPEFLRCLADADEYAATDVALGLLVWTVSFLCQEVLLTWLRLRSGSIWTTSVAHAGNNMTLSLLTGTLLGETSDATVSTMVMTVPMAAVAGWVLLSGRYRTVPQHPTRQRHGGHRRGRLPAADLDGDRGVAAALVPDPVGRPEWGVDDVRCAAAEPGQAR